MAESLDDADWEALARNMLRARLMLHGWSYARLAEALRALGVQETEASIKNKVSRGRFTHVFFLQAMVAIRVEEVEVPKLADLLDGKYVGVSGAQELAKGQA